MKSYTHSMWKDSWKLTSSGKFFIILKKSFFIMNCSCSLYFLALNLSENGFVPHRTWKNGCNNNQYQKISTSSKIFYILWTYFVWTIVHPPLYIFCGQLYRMQESRCNHFEQFHLLDLGSPVLEGSDQASSELGGGPKIFELLYHFRFVTIW